MIDAKYWPAVKVLGLAVVVLIVSGVVLWGLGAAQQLADEGRAKLPGTVEFDGEARRYDVFVSPRLGQGSNTPERVSGRVDCEVERNGEPVATLDGARQGASTVTDFGASVGSFEGGAGRIAVSCAVSDSALARGVTNRFVVAKRRSGLRTAALGGFGLGGVLILIGLLMIWLAARKP